MIQSKINLVTDCAVDILDSKRIGANNRSAGKSGNPGDGSGKEPENVFKNRFKGLRPTN